MMAKRIYAKLIGVTEQDQIWKQCFGDRTVDQITDILHIPKLVGSELLSFINLNMYNAANGKVIITYNSTKLDNDQVAKAKFTIDLNKGSIFKDNVDCNVPGNGFGKKLNHNLYLLAQELGLKTITTCASKISSYSNARHGFEPTPLGWQDVRKVAGERLETMQNVPVSTYTAINAALHSDNPKAIWVIADSPLGKDLLTYNPYDGVLDFSSPMEVERVTGEVAQKRFVDLEEQRRDLSNAQTRHLPSQRDRSQHAWVETSLPKSPVHSGPPASGARPR